MSEGTNDACVRRLIAAMAVCVAAAANPAAAAGLDLPPVGAAGQLQLDVVGTISSRCTVKQASNTASFGDILDPSRGGSRSVSITLPFDFDCNAPFRMSLVSRGGGLTFEGPPPADSDFTTVVAYTADVDLPGISRGDRCEGRSESAQSRAGDGICTRTLRRERGMKGAGEVTLRTVSDPRPILAGRYSDTLTLSFSPVLGGS